MLKKILYLTLVSVAFVSTTAIADDCSNINSGLSPTTISDPATYLPTVSASQIDTTNYTNKSDNDDTDAEFLGVIFLIWNNTGTPFNVNFFLLTDGAAGHDAWCNYNFAPNPTPNSPLPSSNWPTSGPISVPAGQAILYQAQSYASSTLAGISAGPYTISLMQGGRDGQALPIPILANYQINYTALFSKRSTTFSSYQDIFTWSINSPIGISSSFTGYTDDTDTSQDQGVSSGGSPASLIGCTSNVCGFFSLPDCHLAYGDYNCDALAIIMVNSVPQLPTQNALGTAP